MAFRVIIRRTLLPLQSRSLSTTPQRLSGPPKEYSNAPGHREIQKEKPLNPHMTNTTSAEANEMPSVGADRAPPELISSVDPEFIPKDSVPENTKRMTGETQQANPIKETDADLDVGEMEGASFKVEPLRRTGEDASTIRARLLCLSFVSFARSVLILTSARRQIKAAREVLLKVTFSSRPSRLSTLDP